MKKDNKGMTLIELLVAITMLAVVISPFMKTFVISARQNNKARETFRATTVAQNLMEGLEAFTLEDICIQVNKNTGPDSMLYRPNGYLEHAEIGAEKSGNGLTGSDYIFQNSSSDKYEIGIKGIEEDGKKYDAKILLDASGYATMNQDADFSVDIMNEATDVIYELSQEDDKAIIDNVSERWKKTKRTFSIAIKQQNEKKNVQVDIKVTYNYPKQNGGSTESKTSENDLSVELNDVNNLYIFYYPNYNSTSSADSLDIFDIDFQADIDFNLYLVKQKYVGESVTDTNYHAKIDIKDSPSSGEKRPRITLRTNILDDLYGYAVTNANKITYAYKYKGDLAQDEMAAMLNFSGDKPQPLSGNRDSKNLIYKTTVEVYPEGTYPDLFDDKEPLAKLSN